MKFSELVNRPHKDSINTGFSYCKQSTLIAVLGKPGKLTKECSSVTNKRVRELLITKNVGPFRVTGLKPAVESLERIFAKVKNESEELYEQVKTAGMLCCRAIRGSKTTFSNHSWGTAIDEYFGPYIDEMGDNLTQRGLLMLYPFFREEGWFWGAEFSREDSMHFEIANETILKWKEKGII